MINIKINRSKLKKIVSFSVEGHANSDEVGKDIVCASISILTQTAVLALYEVGKIEIVYEMDDGWLLCQVPHDIDYTHRERADIILESMLIGIRGTADMYPGYIMLQDEEV